MNIHTGVVVPALTLGEVGDIYVDTAANTIYKKTHHSTWSSLIVAQPAAYAVDEPTDWNVEPTTIPAALDELASRLRAIE